MLLTVSTTHRPATDLGYLLFKHPDRVQEFEQSFGTATVFYPEADDERCTAALVLDVDPVRLVRSRPQGTPDFSLAQYVNDRPYAASSLLAVAIRRVFSTARTGRCDARPELAATPIPLEVRLPAVPCRPGGEAGRALLRRIFEPLGWQVDARDVPLDATLPGWGPSRYLDLTLRGRVVLADASSQPGIHRTCSRRMPRQPVERLPIRATHASQRDVLARERRELPRRRGDGMNGTDERRNQRQQRCG